MAKAGTRQSQCRHDFLCIGTSFSMPDARGAFQTSVHRNLLLHPDARTREGAILRSEETWRAQHQQ